MTTRNSEEAEQKGASFLPTAHTCSNILELPRGTGEYPLPSVDTLFKLYDLALCQSYFSKQWYTELRLRSSTFFCKTN